MKNNTSKYFIFFFVITVFSFQLKPQKTASKLKEKHFVFFVSGRNNKEWYKKNLDSIFNQKYDNYHVIYVDAASSDGTGQLVKEYIKERGVEEKVTLIINETRRYKMENQYHCIYELCNDSDIVIELDADDWLLGDQVLEYLNKVYSNPNIWLTYGMFKVYPSGELGIDDGFKRSGRVPRKIIRANKFREYDWLYTGAYTYYAGLFKLVKKEDLMYKGEDPGLRGNFLPIISDAAIIFPMLEMCRNGHFKYIRIALCVLNRFERTGWNFYSKQEQEIWVESCQILQRMPKYEALDNLLWKID